ncbi:MAG TPA: PAS domain S-box protein [Dermatophilaceae bacterium]
MEHLLEAVPDALVGMDQKGVIRFVNRQTETLFGYDRDELIGRHIDTLVPDTLYAVYAQHREDYFADPRTRSSGLDLELTARMRDGTDLSVSVSMSSIDTGDVLLVITATRDVITQRRAVEGAQLTSAIVEFSDDAIIGSTLEGVVTSWNPAAERMYGYPGGEIIGTYAGRLSPQDRAGELTASLARLKADQPVERLETLRVRRDGTVFPASITMAPIRDEDGAVVGASVICRDVTEQRKAFEAAQRMAAIVESSDDAIIAETLEGVITSWNPAAERMFGYSGSEIIGKTIALLVPEDRLEAALAGMAEVGAGHHIDRQETFNVRRDGTVFPISLSISPILDDGTVVGASVICRDITGGGTTVAVSQRVLTADARHERITSLAQEAVHQSKQIGASDDEIRQAIQHALRLLAASPDL